MKWLVTVILFVVNVVCLVVSKISLVVVAGEMRDGTPRIFLNSTGNKKNNLNFNLVHLAM